jgi:hypothetical protein
MRTVGTDMARPTGQAGLNALRDIQGSSQG